VHSHLLTFHVQQANLGLARPQDDLGAHGYQPNCRENLPPSVGVVQCIRISLRSMYSKLI
jgi:hypothetical protein